MRVVAKRRGTKHVVFESVDHFRVVEGVSVRGATEKDVLEDPESGHRTSRNSADGTTTSR